jgi:hypothetical protein
MDAKFNQRHIDERPFSFVRHCSALLASKFQQKFFKKQKINAKNPLGCEKAQNFHFGVTFYIFFNGFKTSIKFSVF